MVMTVKSKAPRALFVDLAISRDWLKILYKA